MSIRSVVIACAALVALGASFACGGSGSSGTGTTGGGTTSESFMCCINGDNYDCPDQTSFDNCGPPNLDPSGCTHTGTSPDGMCH